jgi:hypothetical protein
MKAILTYIVLTFLPVVAFTQNEDIWEEIFPNHLITGVNIKKVIKKYWYYSPNNYYGHIDSSLIWEAAEYFDKHGNLFEEKIIRNLSTESNKPVYNREGKIQFVRRLTEGVNGEFIDTIFYNYDSLNRVDKIVHKKDQIKYIYEYRYNVHNKIILRKGYVVDLSGNTDSTRIVVTKYYYDEAGRLSFIENYFGLWGLEYRTKFYRNTDGKIHVIVKEKFYLKNGKSKSRFTFFSVLYNEKRLPESCIQYIDIGSGSYPFYALHFEYESR